MRSTPRRQRLPRRQLPCAIDEAEGATCIEVPVKSRHDIQVGQISRFDADPLRLHPVRQLPLGSSPVPEEQLGSGDVLCRIFEIRAVDELSTCGFGLAYAVPLTLEPHQYEFVSGRWPEPLHARDATGVQGQGCHSLRDPCCRRPAKRVARVLMPPSSTYGGLTSSPQSCLSSVEKIERLHPDTATACLPLTELLEHRCGSSDGTGATEGMKDVAMSEEPGSHDEET